MHGSFLLFLNLGTGEIMLIFFAALLLFGGEKMPGIARTLGRGIRDFKDASEDVKREINNQINNFDEKRERKPALEEINEDNHVADEKVENPSEDNLVSDVQAEDTVTAPEADTAPEPEADAPETKAPEYDRPAGTIEYKG